MAELTAELKEYRLANPLLPKGDISDLSYFWASDSLPKQTVQELPGRIKERMEALLGRAGETGDRAGRTGQLDTDGTRAEGHL